MTAVAIGATSSWVARAASPICSPTMAAPCLRKKSRPLRPMHSISTVAEA